MNPAQVGGNILAYALQIGLLVGLGAAAPAVLRLRIPRARLLYWQVLLVACLALPWVRSWRQEVVTGTIQMTAAISATAVPAGSMAVRPTISFPEIVLWLLAAGAVIRLAWLVAGMTRLSGYCRRGTVLPPEARMAGIGAWATVLLSGDVAGPVTFGYRRPVVLLPSRFPSLAPEMREAILCHELLHVERGDWLFTVAEELTRALLWFHPAIWWVIGEIQLAREQTVDRAVIEMTRAREPYIDTLLLMAGARDADAAPRLDLAPAPMFLRRRHLKRRLLEVVKEVQMTTFSRTRLTIIAGAAGLLVAAACWVATGAFPLIAAPQMVADAPGVDVNMNGSQLMHRSSVPYPASALEKGVEGMVVVQVKLDANGEVSDANVLSGPDDLRKAVLQSVLNWHFNRDEASTTQTVNIDFAKPTDLQVTPVRTLPAVAATFRAAPAPSVASATAKIDRIVVTGLSDQLTDELISKLPVHEGDNWSPQSLAAVARTSKAFDSHLMTALGRNSNGGIEIRISLPDSAASSTAMASASRPITFTGGGFGAASASGRTSAAIHVYSVGDGTSPPMLIRKVDPQYTEEARQAKYNGTVQLSVVVDTDGRAEDVAVVKGIGMGLDEKAVECVQQWVFRPGMNQGVPVNTRALVEINFRLL